MSDKTPNPIRSICHEMSMSETDSGIRFSLSKIRMMPNAIRIIPKNNRLSLPLRSISYVFS
jgi:hypothetical protein